MRLTFWNADSREDRTDVDLEWEACADLADLAAWYLVKEPHTLLHAGRLTRVFAGPGAPSVLSVGIDVGKELVLCRIVGASVHVIDLDVSAIVTARGLAARLAAPMTYEVADALDDRGPLASGANWDTLLLSQIDYILDDERLTRMFQLAAANPRLERIVLLSPSLYSWSKGWGSRIREVVRFADDARLAYFSRRLRGSEAHRIYRRTLRLVEKLSAPWVCTVADRYDYPSGTMHTLSFKRP